MKSVFSIPFAIAASIFVTGCYLPTGKTAPEAGSNSEAFPKFIVTGDQIDRTGLFACDLGGIKFDLSLAEMVSGEGFDLNYSYDLRVKIRDKLLADAEAKRMSRKLPRSSQAQVTTQMAMANVPLKTMFRKRVSAPTLAQIVNLKGSVQYAYFDFSQADTFSILSVDYEKKRPAIERVRTDAVRAKALVGFVEVSGPHDDVRRLIQETTWEHLTVLATCTRGG